MATVTVTTESYVDVPDNAADAEAIVRAALESADSIYLVKVTRTSVLYER